MTFKKPRSEWIFETPGVLAQNLPCKPQHVHFRGFFPQETGSREMKKLLVIAGAVLALSIADSNQALARHHRHGHSHRGYSSPRLSVSFGHRGNAGFRSGYRGYNAGYGGHSGRYGYPAYGGNGYRTWHNTSHYDYHTPSVVPHGNHYHVVPGHYDLHQTGHWDRHGHW